jgi:hypothetical protein
MLRYSTTIMACTPRTLIGRLGRNYLIQKVLKRNDNPMKNVSLARYEFELPN